MEVLEVPWHRVNVPLFPQNQYRAADESSEVWELDNIHGLIQAYVKFAVKLFSEESITVWFGWILFVGLFSFSWGQVLG